MSGKELVLNEEINELSVSAYKKDGAADELVVVLDGSIDSYNSQEFEALMKKLMKAGHLNFTFGCARLNYVSSMGIGVFMNMLTMLKKKNGCLRFAEVQELVKKVFDNLGFSVFFTFQDTLDAGG